MAEQSAQGNQAKLIFACSGAADVGELSDKAARQLHREGIGKMFCLAGVGAKLNNFIETTQAASQILVVDGCPMDCAKKSMENAGISNFDYIRITDMGFQKGKSEINNQTIETIAAKGREFLK